MENVRKNRFVTLDGIRGFAAFLVLFHHIEAGYNPQVKVFYNGFLAVDLFFMLSGFVIAYSYNSKLATGMPFMAFAKIRLIRLWPLAALGAVLGAITEFGVKWQYSDLLSLIKQLLFIPSMSTSNIYPLNAIQWTLFFELLVNFIYALGLWRLNNRSLFLVIGIAFLSMVFTGLHYGTIGVGWGASNFFGGFSRVFFGFFTGVALFRLEISKKSNLNIALPGWLIIIGYLSISIVTSLFLKHTWKIDLLICSVFLPFIVLLSAKAVCNKWDQRVMLLAGALSYPVYALQGPIRHYLINQWGLNALEFSTYGVTIFVVVIFSYLALRFFDEPCRSYLRGL